MRRHRSVPAIADVEDECRRPRAGDRSDHPAAPGVPVGAVVTGPGLAAHDHSGPVGGAEAVARAAGGAAFDRVDQRPPDDGRDFGARSEEHTSELKSLMRTSYAVFFLKKKTTK